MGFIQSSPKDFMLYVRNELNNSADLRFESAAAGEVTIVYLSSIVSQREIEEPKVPKGRVHIWGNGVLY